MGFPSFYQTAHLDAKKEYQDCEVFQMHKSWQRAFSGHVSMNAGALQGL